ncbi:hypothetical protein BS78_K289900 [Paspalum vaginatum]|uniref:Reverse transcriptase domain-containing protein n=1 Tax=Paspalum vaginatum TaxID=158149 RepID=A0A9W7XB57_9POAL|nr:hypothetical protein BS78_K289900 [Paspalum vaginatum]
MINREWLEERRLDTKFVRFYLEPTLVPGHVSDMLPQDILHDPRVGVDIIPKYVVDTHFPIQPRSKSDIRLKWNKNESLENHGVIRVTPVTLRDKQIFVDFHVFDIPEGPMPFILIGLPIASLINTTNPRQLQLQVGQEVLEIGMSRALNTKIESMPEVDPVEEVMGISLEEEEDQHSLEEEASDFSMVEEPLEFEELGEYLRPDPPKIELKQLSPGLKYAFLNRNPDTPVIISDKLAENESRRLLSVLEKYRSVLGYSLQDLKGISPNLCKQRIPMETEHRPTREPQRRLNNAMGEVVKEVLKLLHMGIIYPVQDSEWVSPVQVVPKKGRMTVVKNENNELIPQCTVTGWRMCIDYRKLNSATWKDQFPLLFIDEMLKRQANHSSFCYLDDYSSYH